MNKQELRDALASRGLDTDGLRPLLIQRLESSSRIAAAAADAALKEALASQEDGATEEPPKTESQETGVIPPVEAAEVTLSSDVKSASKDAVAEKETVKEIVAEVVKQEPNGANGSAGSLTDLEKKQRRAERFGMDLQVSEEEKRRKRAARFGGEQGNNKSSVENITEVEKRKQRAARFGIVDESRKKARDERFGHTLNPQEDSVESEKRKARAARFSATTEGSEMANANINSKLKEVLP